MLDLNLSVADTPVLVAEARRLAESFARAGNEDLSHPIPHDHPGG
jgi:hypothetical protein